MAATPRPKRVSGPLNKLARIHSAALRKVSHSRNALASRGETSGYSGSAPILVRIFHDLAHLVPSARLIFAATPATSGSVKAPSELPELTKVAAEVMQISARSTSTTAEKSSSSVT